MAYDVSRETSNVLLPTQVSGEVWKKTTEASIFMQLAQRRELPGSGQEFQIIDSMPEAQWVGETEAKAVDTPTFSTKSWKGYTMAVIVPFSNQFRRDDEKLYSAIVENVPAELAKKFDETVAGLTEAPGELFTPLTDLATVDFETDIWGGAVAAYGAVAAAGGKLNGWAISPAATTNMLSALDGNGRPLFIGSMNSDNAVGKLLGAPVYDSTYVYDSSTSPVTLGYAGDWSNAYFGVVEGLSMTYSDQANVTINGESVSLFQNNMFAIRFEFEVGFTLKFADQLVRLVGAA